MYVICIGFAFAAREPHNIFTGRTCNVGADDDIFFFHFSSFLACKLKFSVRRINGDNCTGTPSSRDINI